jgi:hypothetical protein
MIGVIVNNNRIGSPIPVVDIWVIVRSHAEVSAIEPKTLAVPALQVEDVAGSETECKSAVFKRTINVEALVMRFPIVMPDPLAVRVDVRSVGVILPVAKVALGRFAVPLRDWGNPLGLRGRTRGRWTTGRYVAAAELAAVLFLFVPAAPLLRICWNEKG